MTKRKDPAEKKKAGRKSKKDEINREGLKLCYTRGFTDADTALALQITGETLINWRKQDPEFFATLNNWKDSADGKVEKSLYERACGYNCKETQAQWVTDRDGGNGRWEYAELTKHYPPDPTSMIFWLKNRKKLEWRDKHDVEHSGSVNISISKEDSECL